MNTSVKSLIYCFVIYVVAESAWLYSMNPFYSNEFQKFSKGPLKIQSPLACVLIYPLLLSSFYYFVIRANELDSSSRNAFLRGAFFGLAVYGVYNLTNNATLLGYSWTLVAVDMLWGASLFGILSLLFSIFSKK